MYFLEDYTVTIFARRFWFQTEAHGENWREKLLGKVGGKDIVSVGEHSQYKIIICFVKIYFDLDGVALLVTDPW